MMIYAPDFWPLFWTIMLGYAALTALACLLLAIIARSGPAWDARLTEPSAEPPRQVPAGPPRAA